MGTAGLLTGQVLWGSRDGNSRSRSGGKEHGWGRSIVVGGGVRVVMEQIEEGRRTRVIVWQDG